MKKKKAKSKSKATPQVYTCDKIIDSFGLPMSVSTKEWEKYHKSAGYPLLPQWECLHADGTKTTIMATDRGKLVIVLTDPLKGQKIESPEFDIRFLQELCQ